MKRSPQAEAALHDAIAVHDDEEKRREFRYPTGGELSFFFDDPVRREITGRLMDFSKGGFRVAHDYPALVSGQMVTFRHALSGGQARVVWNRILKGTTETGFVVIALHFTASDGK